MCPLILNIITTQWKCIYTNLQKHNTMVYCLEFHVLSSKVGQDRAKRSLTTREKEWKRLKEWGAAKTKTRIREGRAKRVDRGRLETWQDRVSGAVGFVFMSFADLTFWPPTVWMSMCFRSCWTQSPVALLWIHTVHQYHTLHI